MNSKQLMQAAEATSTASAGGAKEGQQLDIQTIIRSLRDEVDKLKTELDNERDENRALNTIVNVLKGKCCSDSLNT